MSDMLKRALNARVSDVLPSPTPLDPAPNLSARLRVSVFLKREDLTPIFSFKIRGAYNKIAQLSEAERAAGVIAASAGNHAQGVAYSAARLGLRARIVMPRTTPSIKVSAVRRLGAVVELSGDDYSAAAEHCRHVAAETGMTLIAPYDDLDVIAGQATVGLEVLHQAPRALGAIFIPIGGGGLAAGIASVVKELRPEIRIIGVQAEDSDAMARSIVAKRLVRLDHVGIFADGVAVKEVGTHTFDICRWALDDVVTVTTDEICAAIQDAFEDTRSVLEPAGALSIAGLKRFVAAGSLPGGSAVAIASGANMNFLKIGYVTERAEVGEHREAILAVTIPERPGSFLEFCRIVGDRSVTEFNYRLATREEAHIFVGLEVSGRDEAAAIARRLVEGGYPTTDLTDSDLAKTHVRYMVGGRAREVENEIVFAFEFPERPGALLQFLSTLGSRWNISLFHYRNHGSAFGRVLCAFEAVPEEREELLGLLRTLGFDYTEETDDPAVRLFLK
jgi:threonine dehydratase